MTTLILRPEPQASTLAARLREAGHAAIVTPLLQIRPGRQLPQLAEALSRHDLLIAVSSHAVEQASAWLTAHGLAWPQMPTLAVGATTAASWQERGVQPQVPQDARSEGLLALSALHEVQGKRILILRGDGGREFLAEQLRGRGALVDYCECYRRHWLPLDGAALCTQWRTAGVDSVIIGSGEILRRLLELVPAAEGRWLHQLSFIVPSHRVATLVEEAGLPVARVAQGATHAAMVAALGMRNMA